MRLPGDKITTITFSTIIITMAPFVQQKSAIPHAKLHFTMSSQGYSGYLTLFRLLQLEGKPLQQLGKLHEYAFMFSCLHSFSFSAKPWVGSFSGHVFKISLSDAMCSNTTSTVCYDFFLQSVRMCFCFRASPWQTPVHFIFHVASLIFRLCSCMFLL